MMAEKHTPVSRFVKILVILRMCTPTALDSLTSIVAKVGKALNISKD
jgi:hypothetical protein